MKIRVAIVGYGNIGKAVEKMAQNSDDIDVVGIWTRRRHVVSASGTKVYPQFTLLDSRFCGKIDVALLCVGSANDLVDLSLKVASRYSIVDCFDTHAKMREYLSALDKISKCANTLAIVGCGWDPGIFSLERALLAAVMPGSVPQTFWGKGVSQGHSEAIRRLECVKYAIQYTIPNEKAIQEAREGRVDFLPREKHLRDCYVVADYEEFFDKDAHEVTAEEKKVLESRITEQIVNMPNYFAEYETRVRFIGEEEFLREHSRAYHAGKVIACANDVEGYKSGAEFSLKLDSNPNFTANVMLAYARANYRMKAESVNGAKTVLDVPVSYLVGEDGLKFV